MNKTSTLKHVILIGLNFQPHHSTGDKNFWVNMIPLLAESLKRITILSIKTHGGPDEEKIIGECVVNIKYLSPKFLESSSSEPKKKRLFWKEGAFPAWSGIIEKALNTRVLLKILNDTYVTYPYQYVHLMDNMGFANAFLARNLKCPISVSAMSYQGKKPKWLYEKYLRISYKTKNLKVIPYSHAFARKLVKIGINTSNIRRIHWGVNTDNINRHNSNEKYRAKEALGLPIDRPLILWAGYIQQIARDDFLFAYNITKNARDSNMKASFFFAFKPESFESNFSSLNMPDKHIHVTSTNVEKFKLLLSAADLLLSPVVNKECILAPPLTWVEIMCRGIPILTTPVPGADEIIENGKTGIIAAHKEILDLLLVITNDTEKMRKECQNKIYTDYNIKNSANTYIQLWSECL